MGNITYKKRKHTAAFSLAEMLAALVIGSMILIAVLTVYNRLESSASAVIGKLDDSRLPREVLQLIAEDIDRIITDSKDVKISFQNKKLKDGYNSAQLVINRTYNDENNNTRDFEEIVWQTGFDYESFTEGLVLYRSHSGLVLEDKLLDEFREDWQKGLFVPVCSGVSFFQIQAATKTRPMDKWSGPNLPRNLIVTISFAQPEEALAGQWEVPDSEKITRTIAVDRTRKIKFEIVKKEYDADINLVEAVESDANETEDIMDMNDINDVD
jgi:type II secretory pathway component PulJ